LKANSKSQPGEASVVLAVLDLADGYQLERQVRSLRLVLSAKIFTIFEGTAG
jgi:hypothetical protein